MGAFDQPGKQYIVRFDDDQQGFTVMDPGEDPGELIPQTIPARPVRELVAELRSEAQYADPDRVSVREVYEQIAEKLEAIAGSPIYIGKVLGG
jgi:hypothetical protein